MILQVKEKKKQGNYFSLIFKKPTGFNFYPGQYLDYHLPVKDPSGSSRAFTISSSPTEDFLMLSTKFGLSPFKKALAQLKIGDTITTSHPAGTFILDEQTPAVFIAGGVGITPFRSMLKYTVDCQLQIPISLIYSNSDKNFLFQKELENWKKNLSRLKIIYLSSINRHLDKTQLEPIVQMYVKKAIFYLAGPPKMVKDFAKILLDLRVEQINIRYDQFDGY